MGKITNDMVTYAYEVALRVHRGELNQTDGKYEINKKTGMSVGSAGDYISSFRLIMDGKCYTRTINLFAVEYCLDHMGADFGREAQKRAAQAVSEHVQYYKTIHAYLAQTDKLANKYK